MKPQRLAHNPIIRPDMDDRMGRNINGPSLIRVPDWLPDPLGQYYLYFAHHQGAYIRLAYADHLEGPWHIHTPGVLDLKDSYFSEHIASPELRIDPARREIWLYFHGCCQPNPPRQVTRLAISQDGRHFVVRPEILGASYWRVFEWGGYHYALAMPGQLYRSKDGLTAFEEGPTLFTPTMRHAALKLDGDILTVFYSNAGDCPERILMSTIELKPDWLEWRNSEPVTVLAPEMDYEGVDLPLVASARGAIHEPVRQLRDPCIFEEAGRTYLLYSVAGEHGLALAELIEEG